MLKLMTVQLEKKTKQEYLVWKEKREKPIVSEKHLGLVSLF